MRELPDQEERHGRARHRLAHQLQEVRLQPPRLDVEPGPMTAASCECYAVITDPKRKKLFAGIFPEDRIPIKPERATGEGWRGWLTDTERITPEQRAAMVAKVLEGFGAGQEAKAEVEAEVARGLPVREDGAEIHFCPNHLKYGNDTYSMRAFY